MRELIWSLVNPGSCVDGFSTLVVSLRLASDEKLAVSRDKKVNIRNILKTCLTNGIDLAACISIMRIEEPVSQLLENRSLYLHYRRQSKKEWKSTRKLVKGVLSLFLSIVMYNSDLSSKTKFIRKDQ